MLLPELPASLENHREQIARVMRTFCQWVSTKLLDRDRNQILHADVLPDHDAQILDRELAQGNSVQSVTLGNEMGVECRFAPIVAIELLQRFVTVELSHDM